MDWSNVSLEDLVNSLQEVIPTMHWQGADRFCMHSICFSIQVDWTQRPRPIGEFFSCFNLPPSQQKLQARLKCNTFYYRQASQAPGAG